MKILLNNPVIFYINILCFLSLCHVTANYFFYALHLLSSAADSNIRENFAYIPARYVYLINGIDKKMIGIRTMTKRRLILDRLPDSEEPGRSADLSTGRLEFLRTEKVETVFIISSDVVNAEEYLELVSAYEAEGFRVRNIHVEKLDDRAVPGINRIIGEIRERFGRESCLILSYGRSLAPLLVACYYVFEGESPAHAINRVKGIDARFIAGEDEIVFVYKYKRFVNTVSGSTGDDFIFRPLEFELTDELIVTRGLPPGWLEYEAPEKKRFGPAIETAPVREAEAVQGPSRDPVEARAGGTGRASGQ
jgi:hypothetical protein